VRRLVLAFCLMCVACAEQQPAQQTADDLARAAAAAPSDARLAALYRQSCATCHAAADTGAPLTLDRDTWAPRWAKGEDALLRSTVEGLNAMPPGGQCFACTAEDYRALTAFMAGQE
jgi:cytochrome c5